MPNFFFKFDETPFHKVLSPTLKIKFCCVDHNLTLNIPQFDEKRPLKV